MKYRLAFLEKRSAIAILLLCVAVTALIAVADYFANPELSTSIFYVIPISLGVWFGNRSIGVGLAIASAVIWSTIDRLTGRGYSHPGIAYWNGTVRLIFFLIIVYLLASFHERWKLERSAAQTDHLTGALNNRAFYETAAAELERSRRFSYPFSLAYVDLDDFKGVNDRYGHTAGDALLREIVNVMTANTRRSDVVARLGGDEFAILFAETGAEAAMHAAHKLREKIAADPRIKQAPVTVSIGLITYNQPPVDVREMVRFADELMYQVKRQGKNGWLHQSWPRPMQ